MEDYETVESDSDSDTEIYASKHETEVEDDTSILLDLLGRVHRIRIRLQMRRKR